MCGTCSRVRLFDPLATSISVPAEPLLSCRWWSQQIPDVQVLKAGLGGFRPLSVSLLLCCRSLELLLYYFILSDECICVPNQRWSISIIGTFMCEIS